MMASNTNYPDLFTALGKFIAEKKLEDVCLLEFEDGIIITGSVVYETRGAIQRSQETIILSISNLERMTGKRGILGR